MNKLKTYKIIGGLLIAYSVFSIGLATYALYLLKGIETFYRIMVSLLLVLFLITLIYSVINSIKFFKKKKFIISCILTTLLSIVGIGISIVIYTVYLKIDNMNKSELTYKTALISLDDLGKVQDLKDKKIGIVEDKEDIEGNILPLEVIKKYKLDSSNEIVKMSDTVTLMNALVNDEIDAIFISSNYEVMFRNIESLEKDQKIYEITNYEKAYKKTDVEEDNTGQVKKVTEPFTVLLIGVDSEEDDISTVTSFNGDTLMLISVDPETLHATMFSIPRDTYVKMACGGNLSKITHSAWGGTNCIVKTVEDFTGLTVDYYVKINFRGVVDLVNILGGITVDVPIEFCESNSHRWEDEWEICLNKGVQVLNGEQALALARHRKSLALGDFQRGQHQQLVVEGMINQVKTLRSVNDFYNVLNTVSKNIDTNMTTDEMLSFYNVGKSILTKDEDVKVNITKTFLTGYDLYVYEGYAYTYTFQHYKQSLESIVNAMKVNLRQLPQEEIKTFNFSIKTPYEKEIIGYEYYGETRRTLLPNFSEYSLDGAKSWASSYGFTLTINEIESSDPSYYNGQIIGQSVHEGYILEKVPSNITIDVIKKVEGYTPPVEEEPNPDPDPDEGDESDNGEEENNPPENNEDGDETQTE